MNTRSHNSKTTQTLPVDHPRRRTSAKEAGDGGNGEGNKGQAKKQKTNGGIAANPRIKREQQREEQRSVRGIGRVLYEHMYGV